MSTFPVGTRVSVNFPSHGCECGCYRTDGYHTVVIQDDKPGRTRSGTTRVLSPSGQPISEFTRYIKALDA